MARPKDEARHEESPKASLRVDIHRDLRRVNLAATVTIVRAHLVAKVDLKDHHEKKDDLTVIVDHLVRKAKVVRNDVKHL